MLETNIGKLILKDVIFSSLMHAYNITLKYF